MICPVRAAPDADCAEPRFGKAQLRKVDLKNMPLPVIPNKHRIRQDCWWCGKWFDSSRLRNVHLAHIRTLHGTSVTDFPCTWCGTTFISCKIRACLTLQNHDKDRIYFLGRRYFCFVQIFATGVFSCEQLLFFVISAGSSATETREADRNTNVRDQIRSTSDLLWSSALFYKKWRLRQTLILLRTHGRG